MKDTWVITLDKSEINNIFIIEHLIDAVKEMKPVTLLDKKWFIEEVEVKPYTYTFHLTGLTEY